MEFAGIIQTQERIQEYSRFSPIGHIRIGEKHKNQDGKEYPVSLDYFKATGNFAPYFNQAWGEKPAAIDIFFMADDRMSSCYEMMVIRKGSKIYARGDGQQFEVVKNVDKDKSEYEFVHIDQNPEFIQECEKFCKVEWKFQLVMNFLIDGVQGVTGFWQLTSHGAKSSNKNIISAFNMVLQTAGTVRGIPFQLTVDKVKSDKMGDKRVYPVLNLVCKMSLEDLMRIRLAKEAYQELPFDLNSFLAKENDQKTIDYQQTENIDSKFPEQKPPWFGPKDIQPEPEKNKPKGNIEKILQAITTADYNDTLNRIGTMKEQRTWDNNELFIIGNAINTRKRELEELQQGLEGVM